jgi:hypothetical protein
VRHADQEGLKRCSRPDVFVSVLGRPAVRVHVDVRRAAVLVSVQVEGAVAPAPQEPSRKQDDDNADCRFGAVLHGFGQDGVEENHREAEHDDGERVAGAPDRSQPRRATRAVLLGPGHERGDGHQVVRVERVPQPEHERHEKRNHEVWTIH